MLIDILLLIAGLLMIVFGADFLVDGASAVARKLGISEFVIGLTIVGFGTSCPELVVSVTGAIGSNSDVSIGNVVGSNIFNTLLILGLTAVLSPIAITSNNKKRDIPIVISATILLILLGMKRTIFGIGEDGLTRGEGIMFLILFAAYIFLCFKFDDGLTNDAGEKKEMGTFKAILAILAGLAGLVFGGDFFVDSATSIARQIGVSDKFIAITLLAGGTSLPELATCVVAAIKKKGQLALGNILGSNVFNILLILGISATIHPLSFASMNLVDMGVLLISSLFVLSAAYVSRKNSIDRFDGTVFLLCEAAYMVWLFMKL